MTHTDQDLAGADHRRLHTLLADCEHARAAGAHLLGVRLADEAVALGDRLDAREPLGRALSLKGMHELRLGRHEDCLATMRRACALFEEFDDQLAIAAALNAVVLAYHELGLNEEALEQSARGVEIAQQSGDRLTLSWAYNRAGVANNAVGDFENGIAAMQLALELAREIGDEEAEFAALNNIAEELVASTRAHRHAGEARAGYTLVEALELARQALDLARTSGSPHRRTLALLNLGDALGLAGEEQPAREALAEAVLLAEQHGFHSLALGVRAATARIAYDRGELRSAIAQFRGLLDDATETGAGRLVLGLLLALSRAHKRLGEYRDALDYHERYHELDRRLRTQRAETRARLLTDRVELSRISMAAEMAHLDAQVQRARSEELELQKAALERRTELLSRRADEDGLTGLWNRRHIERTLPRMIYEASLRSEPVSVAIIDADDFKAINDTFGHPAGDEVLRRIAFILRTGVRPDDVVARVGGEEFTILLPGASSHEAVQLGWRLRNAVREADWAHVTAGLTPTVSVGVATITPPASPASDLGPAALGLLGSADSALYNAKRAGRDRVEPAGSATAAASADRAPATEPAG